MFSSRLGCRALYERDRTVAVGRCSPECTICDMDGEWYAAEGGGAVTCAVDECMRRGSGGDLGTATWGEGMTARVGTRTGKP